MFFIILKTLHNGKKRNVTETAVQITCGNIKGNDAKKYNLASRALYPSQKGVKILSSIVNKAVHIHAMITIKSKPFTGFNNFPSPPKQNANNGK